MQPPSITPFLSSLKNTKNVKILFFEDHNLRDIMKESRPQPFDHFLHPYIFILKEGKEIHKDFLDYSLLLLQVGQADILPSPNSVKSFSPTTIQLFKR